MLRKHIPNLLTCLNLLSGCLGITIAYKGFLTSAVIFIAVAAIFDFLDGLAARILHVKSAIGKELDSLADVISFGLLPGVIVYALMIRSPNLPDVYFFSYNAFAFLAFLVPVFSALRLAKFNIDTRQENSFLGLPTPASAVFIGSFPLILQSFATSQFHAFVISCLANYYVLAALVILVCLLMVSEIPLFSLKVKSLKWYENKYQYLLLIFSVIFLVTLRFLAIPLIICVYILLSLISNMRKFHH